MFYIYGSANGPVASSGGAVCVVCGNYPCNCPKVGNFLPPSSRVCPNCSAFPCVCTVIVPIHNVPIDWGFDEEIEEIPEATPDYPHICPHCGAPAYIGLNKIDCMMSCKDPKKPMPRFPHGVSD